MTKHVKNRTAPATTTPPAIATTLGALIEAIPALTRLVAHPLPIKVAYHASKLCRLIDAETPHFQAQQTAFFKELAVKRPATRKEQQAGHGQEVTEIPPAQRTEFDRRMKELAALPVTLAWSPVALADLGAITISTGDLLALGPLITGEPAADA